MTTELPASEAKNVTANRVPSSDWFGALPVSLSWVKCSDQKHPPFPPKLIDRCHPEPCLVLVVNAYGTAKIEGPAEFAFFGSREWQIVSGGRRLERNGAQVFAWAPFPKISMPNARGQTCGASAPDSTGDTKPHCL